MPSKTAIAAAFIVLILWVGAHTAALHFALSPTTVLEELAVTLVGAIAGLYTFALVFRGNADG